jgi:hypothetical protein
VASNAGGISQLHHHGRSRAKARAWINVTMTDATAIMPAHTIKSSCS